MVFRLPTHLESFVPPPSEQVPQTRPWQGSLILPASDRGPSQELRVTAVETDGDNSGSSRTDLWPTQLFVRVTHGRSPLRDVQAWVRRHAPPLCTFMPDRLRDAHVNTANQANFRSLSRILFESQMVAIAPWGNQDRIPGAGIILFPAQNTSAILVGAIFLTTPFPDFLTLSPTGSFIQSPTLAQPRNTSFQQVLPPPHYGSMSRSSAPQASSSRQGQYASPIESPTMGSSRSGEEFRYGVSRSVPQYGQSSTSTEWPVVKDEDDRDLSEFTTALRGGHSSSHQYPH